MSNLILIAGGGTGGHIYPAIAIAQKIKKIDPSVTIEFVGTELGLEKKIIPREGYKLHFIKAAALNNVGFLAKIFSLAILPWGILQSIFLILKLKPRLVFGVGGYASGPMMFAALLLRQKTCVFESNAHPGFTNRVLASFVNLAFVNFEVSKKFFKNALVLGFPVREGMSPEYHAIKQSRLSDQKLKVLIFGGSQGARGINKTVLAAIQKSDPVQKSWLEDFEIVHQIGSADWKFYEGEYKKLIAPQVKYFEFLYDMPERYQWADLVVCRAGAATLAELACCGKAAVLIPFPFASDDHQRKNAEAMVSAGAAQMIVQNDFTPEKFIATLQYYRQNSDGLKNLENQIIKFYSLNASKAISQKILAL